MNQYLMFWISKGLADLIIPLAIISFFVIASILVAIVEEVRKFFK